MNSAQRIVLGLGVIVIAVMALFPPWNYVYEYPGDPRPYNYRPASRIERFAGYHAIWKDHTPSDRTYLAGAFSLRLDDRSSLQFFSVSLNTSRLGLQIGIALVITIMLTALASSRRKENRRGL